MLIHHQAKSGQSFGASAMASCLESTLPRSPDLVVLEHIPYLELLDGGEPQYNAELLLNRLRVNFDKTPLIVFLNNHRALDRGVDHMLVERYKELETCIRNGSTCGTHCSGDYFDRLPHRDAEDGEAATDLVAAHYGMGSLSFAKLLRRIVDRNASPGGRNLTSCQLFAALYNDPIHPSKGLGQMLLADLLLHYLATEQKQMLEKSSAETADVIQGPDGSATGISAGDTIEPLDPKTLRVPRMRCYGSLRDRAAGTPIVAGAKGMPAPPTSAAPTGVAAMNALRSDGWSHVEMENGRVNPGWVATEPGAVLQVAVDARFVDPPPAEGAEMVAILTYLYSFEHMGKAELSCLSGCECTNRTFDGHSHVDRHSVPRHLEFQLKLPPEKPGPAAANGSGDSDDSSGGVAPRCILQIRVLEQSRSGEHKVKVIQVAVKTWAMTPAAIAIT